MKAKILILILLSSLILGCRTRTKTSFYSKEGKTEIERVRVDSVNSVSVKNLQKKVSDNNVKQKKEDFSGDIIIKGKSDTLTPFVYHNVINGDTIQSISISGNAAYTINNHYKKSEENKQESKSTESLNEVQKIARSAVSKETIKDVASAVTSTAVEIKSKGFTFGAWSMIIAWGAVLIGACILLYYLSKLDWVKNFFK